MFISVVSLINKVQTHFATMRPVNLNTSYHLQLRCYASCTLIEIPFVQPHSINPE
jgi:hypothetical protein